MRTDRDVDVDLLRERRGTERASFDEIADHLVDFVERHPQAQPVIERLAVFLAAAGASGHHHDHAGATELRAAGNGASRH